MNYELAKALEEAGFPQGGKGSFVAPPDKIVVRREDRLYCPTLSEPIDACGELFGSICRGSDTSWTAEPPLSDEGAETRARRQRGNGSTPEEAVACLWLALNPKS